MIFIPQSSNPLTSLVATAASLTLAMAAIMQSSSLIERPIIRRAARISPYTGAALASNGRTRPPAIANNALYRSFQIRPATAGIKQFHTISEFGLSNRCYVELAWRLCRNPAENVGTRHWPGQFRYNVGIKNYHLSRPIPLANQTRGRPRQNRERVIPIQTLPRARQWSV